MKLLLRFKERPHLEIRSKISQILEKYKLSIEKTFESAGRTAPNINIVVAVDSAHLENIKLDLKRIPAVDVFEQR